MHAWELGKGLVYQMKRHMCYVYHLMSLATNHHRTDKCGKSTCETLKRKIIYTPSRFKPKRLGSCGIWRASQWVRRRPSWIGSGVARRRIRVIPVIPLLFARRIVSGYPASTFACATSNSDLSDTLFTCHWKKDWILDLFLSCQYLVCFYQITSLVLLCSSWYNSNLLNLSS